MWRKQPMTEGTGVGLSALVLLVAGLQAVLLALCLVSRPQRGVLLLALLAPFSGLLLLVPHPPVVDLWSEGLVLATVAASLVAPASARRPAGQRWPPWLPALVGFIAVGVVSGLVVGGTQGLTGVKINYFYALVTFVLWRCPLSARERDHLVSILMGTAMVTAIYGLWQQVVGGAALHALGYEYNVTIRTAGGLLRSFSTFNQPFPFGLYVMVALLVGVPVAIAEIGRLRNALFLLSVPLLVAGMLSSIVRAAVAGLIVGLVFLWAHRYRWIAHAVPVVLVVLVLVPLRYYGPLLSPTSLGQRVTGWVSTFGDVLSAPLGVGIGASGSAAIKTRETVGTSVEAYQPDNYYFKTLYELGSIGLWLFVLLLVSAFGAAVVASRNQHRAGQLGVADPLLSRRDAALAAGIAATVLAAAVASTVATYFEIFPVDLVFWLFLGVLPSLCLPSPPPPESLSAPSPSVPVAAVSRPTSASSSVP